MKLVLGTFTFVLSNLETLNKHPGWFRIHGCPELTFPITFTRIRQASRQLVRPTVAPRRPPVTEDFPFCPAAIRNKKLYLC